MDTEKIENLWGHLHWLTVLAEQGSYTAAASRLGVSKAAMSQRIADLERAAGVPLVRRTTRSVQLTEAGLRLVEETKTRYEDIAASFARVKDSAGIPRGVLRITAPVAFSRQQLVPRLSSYLRDNPQVRVQLEATDQLVSLATEGFDLAIRHSASIPDTHVAWTLCRTRSVIVATRTYLQRRGAPAEPADLAQHDCLYYPRGKEQLVWTFEKTSSRKALRDSVTVPIGGPFAANNSEALRDAALDHLGIALLPDFSAVDALRTGRLVQVLPEWQPVGAFAENLYVIRPYAMHVPRAVSTFVKWLRGTFAKGFPT